MRADRLLEVSGGFRWGPSAVYSCREAEQAGQAEQAEASREGAGAEAWRREGTGNCNGNLSTTQFPRDVD